MLAPAATQMLIQMVTEPPGPKFSFTPREMEVLDMLRLGLSNKEIAERLTVSRATVKFHISSIFSKLGANSRTQAVSIAHKAGIFGLSRE
ncbi:MAG: response regulator transcription factor [Chloroflexi bacterium]|nr:response regulator transcription factor [Chloroflexota bacterium]